MENAKKVCRSIAVGVVWGMMKDIIPKKIQDLYSKFEAFRKRRSEYYKEFDEKHGRFTHRGMLPLYATWILAFLSFPIGVLTGATTKDVLIIFWFILMLGLITMPNEKGR